MLWKRSGWWWCWPANSAARGLGGAFISSCFVQFFFSFRVQVWICRLLPVGGLEDALDVVLFEAVDVVGLDDFVDADEGLLEGVERRRVDHLLLDLGRVRAPAHQEQFRPERGRRIDAISKWVY